MFYINSSDKKVYDDIVTKLGVYDNESEHCLCLTN